MVIKGHTELRDQLLLRWMSHPSIKTVLDKIDTKYQEIGTAVYKRYD